MEILDAAMQVLKLYKLLIVDFSGLKIDYGDKQCPSNFKKK